MISLRITNIFSLLRLSFMLLLLAISFGCQEAVEPDITLRPTIGVLVVDNTGTPIVGATINYAKGVNVTAATLSFWGTSGNLPVQRQIDISSTGDRFTFEITPPSGFNPPIPVYFRDVFIPCKDTTLTFVLPRQTDVQCDTELEDVDIELQTICPEEGELQATASTDWYSVSCTTEITVVTTASITYGSAVAEVRRGGATTQIPLPATVTLSPGDAFRLAFIFTPASLVSRSIAQYRVNARNVVTGTTFTMLNATFSAESACQCDCPTVLTTSTATINVCPNITTTATINLGAFQNRSQSCSYRVRRTNINVGSSDISIDVLNDPLSFSVLQPGQRAGSIELEVTASRAGTFNATIVYAVDVIDANGQTVQTCNSAISVPITIIASDPQCEIVQASTIFRNPFNNYATDTLRNTASRGGIQSQGDSTLIIRNPGKCPLIIENIQLSGTDAGAFTVTSATGSISPGIAYVIPAGGRFVINIAFTPTYADMYPNGDCNLPPKEVFNAVLSWEGPCAKQTIDLIGKATFPTTSVTPSLGEWGYAGNFNYIEFDDQGNVKTSGQQVDDKSVASIFVSAINPTARTCTLESGFVISSGSNSYYVFMRRMGNQPSLPTGTDFCAIVNNTMSPYHFCDECSRDRNDGSYNTTLTNIGIGDIIAIRYFRNGLTFCSFLYITDIGADAAAPGNYTVKFRACGPF